MTSARIASLSDGSGSGNCMGASLYQGLAGVLHDGTIPWPPPGLTGLASKRAVATTDRRIGSIVRSLLGMSSKFFLLCCMALACPITAAAQANKIKGRLDAVYRNVGGRRNPNEPVERDGPKNQRANAELSADERRAWCDWIQEWTDAELDRTAKAKISQSHLRDAYEVLYNITKTPEQESLAAICWIRLTRDGIANNDLPADTTTQTPKWPIEKWKLLAFDIEMKGDIEKVVRAAYRATLTKTEADAQPRWPRGAIEVGSLEKTIAVAEMLGKRKDEWLRWAMVSCVARFREWPDSGLLRSAEAEFIYNLADDEALALEALAHWRKTVRGTDGEKRGMPVIVVANDSGGRSRITWLDAQCSNAKEAADWNAELEPDESPFVRKSFAVEQECWTDRDIATLNAYKRGKPKNTP